MSQLRAFRLQGVTLTDEELIVLVARQESWALAELYDRHARLVFSLALHMLHNRVESEEIVQEVFTKVWRGAHDFSPERGRFSSWLIGITRHQCIDELRRCRRAPATESVDETPSLELAGDDDPVQEAEQSLDRARVLRALGQIPEEQRRMIELAFLEGLTHEEIAAHCSIPLGTVKTRIRLGMEKLRDLLRE